MTEKDSSKTPALLTNHQLHLRNLPQHTLEICKTLITRIATERHCDKDVVALIHSHPKASGYDDPTSQYNLKKTRHVLGYIVIERCHPFWMFVDFHFGSTARHALPAIGWVDMVEKFINSLYIKCLLSRSLSVVRYSISALQILTRGFFFIIVIIWKSITKIRRFLQFYMIKILIINKIC